MSNKMDNQNYRVGRCGWSPACFDSEGNQIHTPETLAAAARETDYDSGCPAGVCTPHRGANLTGANDARVAMFAAAERANRQEDSVPVEQPILVGNWPVRVRR